MHFIVIRVGYVFFPAKLATFISKWITIWNMQSLFSLLTTVSFARQVWQRVGRFMGFYLPLKDWLGHNILPSEFLRGFYTQFYNCSHVFTFTFSWIILLKQYYWTVQNSTKKHIPKPPKIFPAWHSLLLITRIHYKYGFNFDNRIFCEFICCWGQ